MNDVGLHKRYLEMETPDGFQMNPTHQSLVELANNTKLMLCARRDLRTVLINIAAYEKLCPKLKSLLIDFLPA